ncbi:MAG: cell division protein ZapE [Beijerinckiaceae bacterium]
MSATAPQPVSAAYGKLASEGAIERDPAQIEVAQRLDRLVAELAEASLARKSSTLGWLFARRAQNSSVTGVYLWGSVGRGKTMLMDLFFDAAPVARKRRIHFHAFMAEAHAGIHAWRQRKKEGAVKGDDPIEPVAERLASEARLLCFDEFAVNDIADAMILGRLFTALFARGVVVVATSNVEPGRLYENGLNRALFVPFIKLLQQHVDVLRLDARTDFRLEKLSGSPVYMVPANEDARAAMDRLFESLTGKRAGAPASLPVLGRDVHVPQAHGNVARFSFADLCAQPLAAPDYLAIAEAFDTVFIDGIPVIQEHQRNEAKRFINLIDTLYDENVKLVASADAEPHELYLGKNGREVFEFERTASRLIEMRSMEYLSASHGSAERLKAGSAPGIVET